MDAAETHPCTSIQSLAWQLLTSSQSGICTLDPRGLGLCTLPFGEVQRGQMNGGVEMKEKARRGRSNFVQGTGA